MGKQGKKKEIKIGKKIEFSLNMRLTLIMMAVIPMVVVALILSIVVISISSKELKVSTHNSLVEVIERVGSTFDYSTEENKITMRAFAEAPVIKEFLKNPNDAELAEKAEAYTQNYFSKLEGWEGIYLADWNSKVLTHPAPPVVGRVMREGDALKSLQDAMLAASDGVYNVGIITSPASGELIMSMYMPVMDGSTPIG